MTTRLGGNDDRIMAVQPKSSLRHGFGTADSLIPRPGLGSIEKCHDPAAGLTYGGSNRAAISRKATDARRMSQDSGLFQGENPAQAMVPGVEFAPQKPERARVGDGDAASSGVGCRSAVARRMRSVEFATAVLVLLVVIALGLAWNMVADWRGRRR
jgi:hypothetical protein